MNATCTFPWYDKPLLRNNQLYLKVAHGKEFLDHFVEVIRKTADFCFLGRVIFLIQKLQSMIWRDTQNLKKS
jgi:hypothetical protein